VKRTSEETAARVEAVKDSLDQLSRDVVAQTQRVAEKGGEISEKLDSLDAAANEAQKRAELYQARAEELSQHLESMAKGLETRVEQVSKQIDNVSIRKAYPTLGQQFFVTYNGERWKD
jgi:predicted  nucleic acid-binding Zn-ribbon protein